MKEGEKIHQLFGRRKFKYLESGDNMIKNVSMTSSKAIEAQFGCKKILVAPRDMGLFTCKTDGLDKQVNESLTLMRVKARACTR